MTKRDSEKWRIYMRAYYAKNRERILRNRGTFGKSAGRRRTDPLTRFMAGIAQEDGCWLWQGYCNRKGYAVSAIDKRPVQIHRWMYEYARGPIPEGLQIDHLCRRRNCVNPDHLEAVTQAENLRRGVSPSAVNARKTRCK